MAVELGTENRSITKKIRTGLIELITTINTDYLIRIHRWYNETNNGTGHVSSQKLGKVEKRVSELNGEEFTLSSGKVVTDAEIMEAIILVAEKYSADNLAAINAQRAQANTDSGLSEGDEGYLEPFANEAEVAGITPTA